MQKRSHKLLASSLLESENGFSRRRFELAFLFGSFEPDCNPLTYLRGSSLRTRTLGCHSYNSTRSYLSKHIEQLQSRSKKWTIRQYYLLGKLTHYLADAFTFPHNEHYQDNKLAHHMYETALRSDLENYLRDHQIRRKAAHDNVIEALTQLHDFYIQDMADQHMDIQFIVEANRLLMAGCRPKAAAAPVVCQPQVVVAAA